MSPRRCATTWRTGSPGSVDISSTPARSACNWAWTNRSIATELGLHESTVSRAIARKYVRTPRGTIPLRDFFASGIETEGGGSASSTAIQDMIRKLVAAEDPRKPLSDARLADTLKADGVPVARRTVAKYREALHIPASHERVRIG